MVECVCYLSFVANIFAFAMSVSFHRLFFHVYFWTNNELSKLYANSNAHFLHHLFFSSFSFAAEKNVLSIFMRFFSFQMHSRQ